MVTGDMLALKITLAMIDKFMNAASYGIIYLCAAEIFPTVVRNAGVGVSSMSARIRGMLAPQVLKLNAIWIPLPMIIFGGMSILARVLALLIPETVGKRLPQTIEDITKSR
ncbi:hypothetical protein KUTeg_007127 [Tegillarca granosa]|uniref:Major facilitator superfamily (MFS) profile domain-containing protein n=1 Tax=Tegillarca granosa TaxID=220873 RepID=A0ABQ9FCD1_TEGGR|nr:hypothetical protein KUTeg_007127 [Tegillarca granosa]